MVSKIFTDLCFGELDKIGVKSTGKTTITCYDDKQNTFFLTFGKNTTKQERRLCDLVPSIHEQVFEQAIKRL